MSRYWSADSDLDWYWDCGIIEPEEAWDDWLDEEIEELIPPPRSEP